MSEIENRNKIRKREKLTWPGPAAQQAGPASWSCQSSPSSRQEDRGTRCHAPGHLLPPCLLRDSLQRRHVAPDLSRTLPRLIPSSVSLSHARPSPPTPFAAATTTASPPRRLPKLRRSSLFLLTKTEGAGSPGWGQLRRSPPRPPRIAAVKSAPVRPPSSSPSTSTGST